VSNILSHQQSMKFVLIILQSCRTQLLKVLTMLRALSQHRQVIHSTSPCLHLDYHPGRSIRPTIPSIEAFLLFKDPSTYEQHERIRYTRTIKVAPRRIVNPYRGAGIAKFGRTESLRSFARYTAVEGQKETGIGSAMRNARELDWRRIWTQAVAFLESMMRLLRCSKWNSNCTAWRRSVLGTCMCSSYK